MKIHKNDIIKIITGKDKGKSGKVLKVFLEKEKILVEGLNFYKKHVKSKKQGEKGQIISVPRPISVSNIMLVCSSCNRTARAGYRFENENKIRICKKCGAKL